MSKYTDQELVKHLRDCYDKHGEVTTTILNKASNNYPSGPTFSYRFGSFSEALEEAGLSEEANLARNRSHSGYTEEYIKEYVENIAEDGKITRRMVERSEGPTVSSICRNLDIDSLSDINVNGIEVVKEIEMEISDKSVVDSLLKKANEENKYLTYSLLDKNNDYPSSREVKYYYTDLTNAARELNLTTKKNKKYKRIVESFSGNYIVSMKLSNDKYYVGKTKRLDTYLQNKIKNKNIKYIDAIVKHYENDRIKPIVDRISNNDNYSNILAPQISITINLTCENCGKEIKRKERNITSEKVFCTRECKQEYKLEERTCVVCESTENVPRSRYKHIDGWVCSKECNRKKYRETIFCVVCGNKKEELESKERKLPYRCSTECKKEYSTVTISCDVCGDEFTKSRYSYKTNQNNYCSRECLYKSNRREESYQYKHRKWSEKVKDREDHICENCGNSYDVMCAHHNPPKTELSEEEVFDVNNGVCLCYPCHANKHDSAQKKVLLSWWDWYQSK